MYEYVNMYYKRCATRRTGSGEKVSCSLSQGAGQFLAGTTPTVN